MLSWWIFTTRSSLTLLANMASSICSGWALPTESPDSGSGVGVVIAAARPFLWSNLGLCPSSFPHYSGHGEVWSTNWTEPRDLSCRLGETPACTLCITKRVPLLSLYRIRSCEGLHQWRQSTSALARAGLQQARVSLS